MERTRPTGSFTVSGRSLEDAFFLQEDRLLVERRIELHKMQKTKEALAEVSGIKDQGILEQLVRLGVGPETLAALALVPLIEVVWADGRVDEKERELVLAHANKQGIQAGSIEHDLLDRWLRQRPGKELLEAWRQYVDALCSRMDEAARGKLKNELLRDVRAAAQASGGFLGLRAISSQERAVLDKLESSFCGG
jgi:hypothetical protein